VKTRNVSGERVGGERRRIRVVDRRESAVYTQLLGAVLGLLPDTARSSGTGEPTRQRHNSDEVSVRDGVVARPLGRLLQRARRRPRCRRAAVRLVLGE